MENFPTQWSQHRFNTNIGTYLSEELSCYIPDDIVTDGGKGTFQATKCMAYIEGLATWAVRGKSSWCPDEPEA